MGLLRLRLNTKRLMALLLLACVILLISTIFLQQEFQKLSQESDAHDSFMYLHSIPRVHLNFFRGNNNGQAAEDEIKFVHIERAWKKPEWPVAEILRQLPAMKKPVVPVFIVEEHFEVLKHWFDAAQTGAIPKSGNTVFHIDGHSDTAPPRDVSQLPLFRLPFNHSEVANMMQSNDVFIVGSAIAGLINRYIWVWPDWDQETHSAEGESDHHIIDAKAGWRTYYPSSGDPILRFCLCQKVRSDNETLEHEWECIDDEPDRSELGNAAHIAGIDCEAEVTWVMEHVHESKAMILLHEGNWVKKDENVILDIDEDYYGCESSVMPLINAGLSLSKVRSLSQFISSLLCVNEVRYEQIADKFFRTLVQIVQDFKASVCPQNSPRKGLRCLSDFESDKTLIQMIPQILESFEKAGIDKLLCHRRSAELMLQIVIRTLYEFNSTQFEALKYVGVCLVTAPTSMQFSPNSLHMCHGFNVPGDMSVSVHVPTKNENKMRSAVLKKTLSLLPRQPSLVTLCRSMRDGYTPWAFFDDIEKDVLEALESEFPGVTKKSFHFDENLMGGRLGWPQRHKH